MLSGLQVLTPYAGQGGEESKSLGRLAVDRARSHARVAKMEAGEDPA